MQVSSKEASSSSLDSRRFSRMGREGGTQAVEVELAEVELAEVERGRRREGRRREGRRREEAAEASILDEFY